MSLAVATPEQIDQNLDGQVFERVLLSPKSDHIRFTVVMNKKLR